MERIIIDTDPGVDDAMAILLAVKAADRLQIEALTRWTETWALTG